MRRLLNVGCAGLSWDDFISLTDIGDSSAGPPAEWGWS